MPEPYWNDGAVILYTGDVRDVLAELPAGSADCIVGRPPRFVNDSEMGPWPRATRTSTTSYLAWLRAAFAEANRVLAREGTAWLAVADTYATEATASATGRHARPAHCDADDGDDHITAAHAGASLMGFPWQAAFALDDDGWTIRNAIVWRDPSRASMPAPAPDCLVSTYDLVFLLVKDAQYWFDLNPIPQPHCRLSGGKRQSGTGWPGGDLGRCGSRTRGPGKSALPRGSMRNGTATSPTGRRHGTNHPASGNPGDVWTIPAQGQSPTATGALPVEVAMRCIAAGCRPGGTVLDMFCVNVETGIAARRLGRPFIGIAPDADTCNMIKAQLSHELSHDNADPDCGG
jgi:DNA modification methylase